MLTADQLDAAVQPILALYARFEQSIIEDIARRLGKLPDVTDMAAWQMQRVIQSGSLYESILNQLSILSGKTRTELRAMFEKAGVKAMAFDDAIYVKAGLQPLPLNLSPQMSRVLLAGLEKTAGLLHNLTVTTAITGQDAFIQAVDLAYMQVTSGTMSYTQAIRAAVKKVASDGLSVVRYPGKTDHLDVATRRAVLTGVNTTVGQLQIARADELGQDLVQTSAHIGARNKGEGPMNHESWQGRIFSRTGKGYPDFVTTTGYGTGEGLLGWNCVIGATLVSGPTIRAGYRREYSGEVLILRTSAGHKLTVTPNHPILTPQGWIAAGLLNSGDYVISSSQFDRRNCSSPNIDEQITSIEDIFNSLSKCGNLVRFPASTGYFHGDISDGEIDAVFPEGFLWGDFDSSLFEHAEKIAFGCATHFPESFSSLCTSDEVCFGPLHSSDRVMGGFGNGLSSFWPNSLESNPHGFSPVFGNRITQSGKTLTNRTPNRTTEMNSQIFLGPSSQIKSNQLGFIDLKSFFDSGHFHGVTKFIETLANDFIGTSKMPGNIAFPHSFGIQADKLVFIKREFLTSAHVYNLSTEGEWYFANGIITHNCRHSFFPFYEGISQNAYDQATLDQYANKTVSLNGQPVPVYDATQYQRGIERKIRHWKRQAAALEAAGLPNDTELLKVKDWQAAMRAFVKETGLIRQPEREVI